MRKKLRRFADNAQRHNVLEPGKPIYETIKGQWCTAQFDKRQRLVVELGCGTGTYTIGLAQLFPDQNFVGVDIKGARLWAGSSAALALGLRNVAFLRTRIEQLDQFFAPSEVSELYITFPDPRPRDRDAKRRLTSPRFLACYQKLLQSGGYVHLKTDNTALFNYTLEVLNTNEAIGELAYTEDLYQSEWVAAHHGLKTVYEQRFLAQGVTIKYLRFSFKQV